MANQHDYFQNQLSTMYEYNAQLATLQHHPNFEHHFAAEFPKRARMDWSEAASNPGTFAVLNHVNYRVPSSHFTDAQLFHHANNTTAYPTTSENTFTGKLLNPYTLYVSI